MMNRSSHRFAFIIIVVWHNPPEALEKMRIQAARISVGGFPVHRLNEWVKALGSV
jgi:hypothetical protein